MSAWSRHDRHRLGGRVHRRHGLGIDRDELGAVGRQPPCHLVAQRPRHQRLGPGGQLVVERRAVLPGDLDDVPQAPRSSPARPWPRAVPAVALVATVGPWASSAGPARCPGRPAIAPATAWPGSSGVDSTLATRPSSATRSVNVPPVSTPTRTGATYAVVPVRPRWVWAASDRQRADEVVPPVARVALHPPERHVARAVTSSTNGSHRSRLATGFWRVDPAPPQPPLPPAVPEAVDVGRVADDLERPGGACTASNARDLHALVGVWRAPLA